MEILFRGKKAPEDDKGPYELGYFFKIFFVEDMGHLNKVFPEKFRREEVSVSSGGMSLAEAMEKKEETQAEWGIEITSFEGQAGCFRVEITPEIPPDNPNQF